MVTVRTTVIVPVGPQFSREHLHASLGSIRADVDKTEAEILLVADGVDTLESFAKNYNAQLLVLKKEDHLYAVLNKALSHVGTEFTARLDADDLWPSGRARRQEYLLDMQPSVALTGGAAHIIDTHGNFLRRKRAYWWSSFAACFLVTNTVMHPSVMMRTNAIREAGGYPAAPRVEDYALWLRLLAHGYRISITKSVEVFYRSHDMQLTQAKPLTQRDLDILRSERLRLGRRIFLPGIFVNAIHHLWSVRQRRRGRVSR